MAKKEEQSTEVAELPKGSMPAEMMGDLAEFAGAGVSDRQEDFVLPFLMIAQANSPQLKKQQTDKFIPGLEAGDIFNTATRQFWKGEEGVSVVQSHFQKALVEWILRDEGGGYVATYDIDADVKKQARWGGEDNRFLLLPNGHQLVDTSYHFVTLAEDCSAAVIGMTSTSLACSRTWQTIMKEVKVGTPNGLVVAPCFSRVYRLRTAYKTKDTNSWFVFTVSDEGWTTPKHKDAYLEARKTFVHIREHGAQLGRPPESDPAAMAEPRSDADHSEVPI